MHALRRPESFRSSLDFITLHKLDFSQNTYFCKNFKVKIMKKSAKTGTYFLYITASNGKVLFDTLRKILRLRVRLTISWIFRLIQSTLFKLCNFSLFTILPLTCIRVKNWVRILMNSFEMLHSCLGQNSSCFIYIWTYYMYVRIDYMYDVHV